MATAAFSVFTATVDGLVPAPGAATGRFLKDDGTWSAVSVPVTSVSAGSTMVSVSPTTGAVVVDVVPANFTGIPESGVTGLVADLAARPTGSGSLNKLSKWSSATALTDSLVSDDGTTFAVNTSKVTVDEATGNTAIAGTLGVTGNFSVNTSKVTIDAATGNTVIAGTLSLTPLTQGSVLFAGAGGLVSQDNTNLFYDDTNNRLGVGTNAPSTAFHTVGDASVTSGSLFVGTTSNPWSALQTNATFTQQGTFNTVASVVFSNTAGDTSGFTAFKARGTIGSPSAIQSADAIGSYGFTGATDSSNNHFSGAYLLATATENWATGTNSGTKFEIYTTKNATSVAAGGRQARVIVDNDGKVIIPGAVNSGTTSFIVGATANTKTATTGVAEFTKDATCQVAISSFGTGVNPALNFLRGRGTAAATTAVQSGDFLGVITFSGTTSSGAGNTLGSAFISSTATENWSPGCGSRLSFTTCLTGGTTRAEKFGIENDGGITLSNSSSAAVGAAGTVVLRSNTQLQVSENAGAFATVAKGTGAANTLPKWSNTTGTLTNSLVTDNGTTFAINTNKFTVTEASGNTSIAGTLSVTGNSGFNGTAPIAKPTISGSRGGNAALASLLTALANYGLITDSTTA